MYVDNEFHSAQEGEMFRKKTKDVLIVLSGTSTKGHSQKGHHRNYLPKTLLSKVPKVDFRIVLIHFLPLKSGQPIYSGQIS